MPICHVYDHSGNPPTPDELAACIAFLQSAKIRAQQHISNPWGYSWLEQPEQELIDSASSDIDNAVQKLEALRNILQNIPREARE